MKEDTDGPKSQKKRRKWQRHVASVVLQGPPDS